MMTFFRKKIEKESSRNLRRYNLQVHLGLAPWRSFIMRITGLSSPDELAMLDGSPPCQGVLMAGKHRINDGRNQLFDECYVLRVSLVKAENGLPRSAGGFALSEFKRFG